MAFIPVPLLDSVVDECITGRGCLISAASTVGRIGALVPVAPFDETTSKCCFAMTLVDPSAQRMSGVVALLGGVGKGRLYCELFGGMWQFRGGIQQTPEATGDGRLRPWLVHA